MNLLILGGTTEATMLGRALAGDPRFNATISLAGRTRHPAPQPLPSRTGGFGGVDGLARTLREHRIDVLIDATHPFASQITAHATQAAQQTGTALLVVLRPPWQPIDGDRWITVPTMTAAAVALGLTRRRVLLTVGQQDLAPFVNAPWHHYVLRSVDPPALETQPPNTDVITARGPFTVEQEHRLLREQHIEVIVTKNSGGTATVAKLSAARALELPVVMVERPPIPTTNTVANVNEVLTWLAHRHVTVL